MRRLLPFPVLFLALFAFLPAAGAVEPDEMLANPVLEKRARDISQHLRCLVCQNQSIDDSNAELAKDLRVLVRERLKAGDADDDVIRFVVARYGDYVLLKPPFKLATLGLWLGPALIFLLAAIAAWMFLRRGARARVGAETPKPLDDAERRRIDALLKGDGA